ncbi:MAG TPA: copper resistance protein CopC, partial [Pseudonocardia sp.]|uniref:copper resistance protein CopC n=1 Tax=Pseudonocardia sp. TaxID=60912 RepID=UPI002B4B2E3D
KIGYRVVSADGHPVSGEVSFTLTTPGPGAGAEAPASAPASEPAPAAAPPAEGGGAGGENGGTPIWPWILGAVVLVGGGVVAALRLGRS